DLGLLGFTCQKPHGGIEPLVPASLVLSHTDPLGEHREERLSVRAFELECAAQQIRSSAAAAVAKHRVQTPRGTAGDILEWNRWCRRLIAELVFEPRRNQQQVALLKSDCVALAPKAQPAGAPFDDVEMREVSPCEPDCPRCREFTPAEDPALQLEG